MAECVQHHDSALKFRFGLSSGRHNSSKFPFNHVTVVPSIYSVVSTVSHSPCSLCCATTLSAKPIGFGIIWKQRGSYCHKIAFVFFCDTMCIPVPSPRFPFPVSPNPSALANSTRSEAWDPATSRVEDLSRQSNSLC
jgi:hypothetical protein